MDLTWDKTTVSLLDIIKNASRPEIVRFKDPVGVNLGPEVDTSQPLLLYSHRKRSKVCCKQLKWDSLDSEYVSDGTLIEIPKDFPGQLLWCNVYIKTSTGLYIVASVVRTYVSYIIVI